MKKLLLLTTTLLPLIISAQSLFTVKGAGKAFKNGDKIYLVYKVGDSVICDSTIAVNNAFKFKGNITGKAKGTLYKNENPMTSEIVHDDVDLYVEPGIIVVTSKDSLIHAKLSGTITNVDFSEINTELRPLRHKLGKLSDGFDALAPEQQKDINIVAAFRLNVKKINRQMEPIQFAFIKSHPASYISLVTLKQLVGNAELLPKVEKAYQSLAPALKRSGLGKDLGEIIAAAKQSASGAMAINFTQPDTNGRPVRLSDFRGKYVLIDFWASWCMPCRAENPNIVAAYNQYKDKGFTVLGISLDDKSTQNAWLMAIKDDGLTWTQVSDLKGSKNAAKLLYGVTVIPANILIDPSGKIVAKNIKDKMLLNKLNELLGTSSPSR